MMTINELATKYEQAGACQEAIAWLRRLQRFGEALDEYGYYLAHCAEMTVDEMRARTEHIGQLAQLAGKKELAVDLGLANNWAETPAIVKDCQDAGHHQYRTGPESRVEVKCDKCRYVFSLDCSD